MDPTSIGVGVAGAVAVLGVVLPFLLKWKPRATQPASTATSPVTIDINTGTELTDTGSHEAAAVCPEGCSADRKHTRDSMSQLQQHVPNLWHAMGRVEADVASTKANVETVLDIATSIEQRLDDAGILPPLEKP